LKRSIVADLTIRGKLGGMISLGCFTLIVIVFIKCSLAVTTKELEVGPKITSIADEAKEQLEKTKRKPCQPCQGPPTVGFCKRLNSGYTFDQDSNSCKRFEGPGCELTNNAFPKKEECESKCRTSNFRNTFTLLNNSYGRDTISMFGIGKPCEGSPVLHGMCEKIERKITGFMFNSKTARCEHFATIGCKLSENGFKSKEMCQRACEKEIQNQEATSIQARVDDACCLCPMPPMLPTCRIRCCKRVVPIPEGIPVDIFGCWKDDYPVRALESAEELIKQRWPEEKDRSYKNRENAVGKCFDAAQSLGRKVFAIQDGGQCFTEGPPKMEGDGDKWKGDHKAYGLSDKCESDGKGGPMANEVYVVIEAYCFPKCKVCKPGGSSDGGKPLNADGACEYFCSKNGYCGTGKYYKTGINCNECKINTPSTPIPPVDNEPKIKFFGSYRWLVIDYSLARKLGDARGHFCPIDVGKKNFDHKAQYVLICASTATRFGIKHLNGEGFGKVTRVDPKSLDLIPQWRELLRSCLPDTMEFCNEIKLVCEVHWHFALNFAKETFQGKAGTIAVNPDDPLLCPAEWKVPFYP